MRKTERIFESIILVIEVEIEAKFSQFVFFGTYSLSFVEIVSVTIQAMSVEER